MFPVPVTWQISFTPSKGNNSLNKFNFKRKRVVKGVGAHVCVRVHMCLTTRMGARMHWCLA